MERLKALSIKTTLAYVVMLRGNLEEARELAQDAVERYQRILGCEYEKTLQCTTTLYLFLQEMGQYREAINICLEVTIRRALLDPQRPHTLSVINNLAILRRKQGRF